MQSSSDAIDAWQSRSADRARFGHQGSGRTTGCCYFFAHLLLLVILTLLAATHSEAALLADARHFEVPVSGTFVSVLMTISVIIIIAGCGGGGVSTGGSGRSLLCILCVLMVCATAQSWPWGSPSPAPSPPPPNPSSADDDGYGPLALLLESGDMTAQEVLELFGKLKITGSHQEVWLSDAGQKYRNCAADSCLRRNSTDYVIQANCSKEYGQRCLYFGGRQHLLVQLDITSVRAWLGGYKDSSAPMLTRMMRYAVAPTALMIDVVAAMYEVVYQRSSGAPNPLVISILDLPESRVQKLSVLVILGYLLTLTNSLFRVSISCEAGRYMTRMEYGLRVLAAVILLLGGFWIYLFAHNPSDPFWGSASYGNLLAVHIGSTLYSAIYLLEEDVQDMSIVRWVLYPAIFPVGVIITVAFELAGASSEYYVVLKTVLAVCGLFALAFYRRVVLCNELAELFLSSSPGQYYRLLIPLLSLFCAPDEHVFIWRSPLSQLLYFCAFFFLSVWQTFLILFVIACLNALDFNAFDWAIGDKPVMSYVTTTVTRPFEIIPDYGWLLAMIELVLVCLLVMSALKRTAARILRAIISDSVDLTRVSRFDGDLPWKVRLLMWLSSDVENSMRTIAVVTGGGKTTTAVLTSIDHVALLGGASLDKDAMTSSRQNRAEMEEAGYSTIDSMTGADALDALDEEEPLTTLGMWGEVISRFFGKRILTGREKPEMVGRWFRARAEEIIRAGRTAGVKSPLVLVMVHSPADVRSCGLPLQSWCGIVTPAEGQLQEVLRTRSLPVAEGGRGADIDVLKRRVEMDKAAGKDHVVLTWPRVAECTFYNGLPVPHVYLTIPTLTGGEPYVVPDYVRIADGKAAVKVSAMGVSSDEMLLEQTQLTPASGGLLVPLKLWPSGMANPPCAVSTASTWNPPNSVSTAGPQRPDRMPEDMPDRTPDSMSDRMPEDMPDKMPEDMPDRMPEDIGMPDRMSDRMPEGMPDKVPECLPDRTPEDLPDRMPGRMSEDMPEDMPDRVPEHMPEDMPGRMPEDMPDRMPDRMPENMSDRMPEDLPVTKCKNVMVGITRSKVIIFPYIGNVIIPTDELIFFRGVAQPPTR